MSSWLDKIKTATSVKVILGALDLALSPTPENPEKPEPSKPAPVSFGVMKATKKRREQANQGAVAILERVQSDPESLSEEDRAQLRQYTGLGGIGGTIFEYYTPQHAAEGGWDALKANGLVNGNVLEPSAGPGVFNGTKPDGIKMTATEIDPVSSGINQVLHPEDQVLNHSFEELAVNTEDDFFDAVTGNVPFGDTRGEYAAKDPEYQDVKYIEQYFLLRSIDKVRPGGLVCLFVPPNIVSRKSFDEFRERICRRAEFLGAHKLPSGTFKGSGTDTVVDVIVLRKHSVELAEKLKDLSDEALRTANVLWDTFIDGRWFDEDGKRFIMGDVAFDGNFGGMTVKGNVTDAQMKEKLAHKFDSRIDWGQLDVAVPETKIYAEGDQRLINDRWHELTHGEWKLVDYTAGDGDSLDPKVFGSSSLSELADLLLDPLNVMEFTLAQLRMIQRTFPDLVGGELREILKLVDKQPAHLQQQVFRAALIGTGINGYQHLVTNGEGDSATRERLQKLVFAEREQYGPFKGKGVHGLVGGAAAHVNAFINAMDASGEFSDLLKGTLDTSKGRAFDSADSGDVVNYLFTQADLNPVTLEDFLSVYTGDKNVQSLADLATDDSIAITTDGMLEPFDRFVSGDTRQKITALKIAMADETDTRILQKWQDQINAIQTKRHHTPVDKINIQMNSKWLNRRYVLEFLQESGYRNFHYSKLMTDDEGEQWLDKDTNAPDGVFGGYRFGDNGKKKSSPHEQFERQLESYLNGVKVRGGDSTGTALHKRDIARLETRFASWIRQHDDIEQIEQQYNDTFNGYIHFEHSGDDLQLNALSDAIRTHMYQNSGVRRLSEDGRGILGYGTGLGKTFTALALAAYNKQMGRSKRTGIVVPKAVIENWYHESRTMYGSTSHMLFVGIEVQREPVVDEQGKQRKDPATGEPIWGDALQEPVLDEEGNHQINKFTGEPEYRDVIRVMDGPGDSARVAERMASIPQSNYDIVVMTKEQFAAIPMKPESKEAYMDEMVEKELVGARQAIEAIAGTPVPIGKSNYKEAKKLERFKEKYSSGQTLKKGQYPYFEDMRFDSIIVDEGHNYRNSYQPGRETGQIAYLPTSASAKSALDMTLKMAHLRKTNNDRGPVILTATPTVNSPTDIFNMLSLVLSPQEFEQYGIFNVDDFIKVFGDIQPVEQQKLSGKIEEVDGLVGFKNLSGLRGLFHRWVNLKSAKDVGKEVDLPTAKEYEKAVEMSPEQATLYEELRQRADDLSNKEKDERRGKDSTFAIIRDMDRVCTDLDLYYRTMTFLFQPDDRAKVEQLIEALPETVKGVRTDDSKQDDESRKENDFKYIVDKSGVQLEESGSSLKLVVPEDYENEVVKRLQQFDIADVSHPVTPKYAAMLKNLKRIYKKGGKQLIFTDEKTQHNKIKRLIVHHLGIPESEIGIINADTVASKKGDEQGLEAIAAAYNTGKFRIVIANKKAEVGINLQKGTVAIHHLTLPWTPASIEQRNGRGVRQGNKQKRVLVFYYMGKGSFDAFRLRHLKSKAGWMDLLWNGTDEEIANANADDHETVSLLLAPDPEELKARMEAQRAEKERRMQEAAKARAVIDLNNFIKAKHDIASAGDDLDAERVELREQQDDLAKQLYSAERAYGRAAMYGHSAPAEEAKYKRIKAEHDQVFEALKNISARYKRKEKAQKQITILKGNVQSAMDEGVLELPDGFMDNAARSVSTRSGEIVSIGDQFEMTKNTGSSRNPSFSKAIIEVVAVDFRQRTVKYKTLVSAYSYGGDSEKIESMGVDLAATRTRVSYTPERIEIEKLLKTDISYHELYKHSVITKDVFNQFRDRIKLASYQNDPLQYDEQGNMAFVYSHELDKERLVYPEPSEAFRSQLAKLVLSKRKDNGYYPTYEMNEQLIKAVFGNDWRDGIAEYGNKASEATINQYIAARWKEWQDSEEGKKLLADLSEHFSISYQFKKYANKESSSLGDNTDTISRMIDAFGEDLYNKYRQEHRANQEAIKRRQAEEAQREAERLEAARKAPLTTEEVADFERFKELAKEAGGYHALVQQLTDIEDSETAYPFVKLDVEEGEVRRELDEFNLVRALTQNGYSTGDDDKLSTMIGRLITDLLPEATGDQRFEELGLTLKVNSGPVVLGDYGRRRGKHYDAGTMLFLQDDAGKNGPLFRAKDDLKSRFGAKYAKDKGDELPGSWWAIPAETDRDTLYELLKAA